MSDPADRSLQTDIAALGPMLSAGAASLGLPLDDARSNKLLQYLGLLQRWNAVYNLTAVREPRAMLVQHLLDCLAVLPPMRRHLEAAMHGVPVAVLDVGSGGGLPGVVLALLEPQWEVTCVDAVGKKAGFVRQVAAELAVPNLRAEHARVEDLTPVRGYDMIVARAFASLAALVRPTRSLLAPGGVWMAMKGAVPHDEIAALPPDIDVFHVEQLQVPGLDGRRCLVWMRQRAALS